MTTLAEFIAFYHSVPGTVGQPRAPVVIHWANHGEGEVRGLLETFPDISIELVDSDLPVISLPPHLTSGQDLTCRLSLGERWLGLWGSPEDDPAQVGPELQLVLRWGLEAEVLAPNSAHRQPEHDQMISSSLTSQSSCLRSRWGAAR